MWNDIVVASDNQGMPLALYWWIRDTCHIVANMYSLPVSMQYIYVPYSLDQTPLSISRRTAGCAERNSRSSRILAATNIRVARAHETKTSTEYQLQFKDCRKHSIMD